MHATAQNQRARSSRRSKSSNMRPPRSRSTPAWAPLFALTRPATLPVMAAVVEALRKLRPEARRSLDVESRIVLLRMLCGGRGYLCKVINCELELRVSYDKPAAPARDTTLGLNSVGIRFGSVPCWRRGLVLTRRRRIIVQSEKMNRLSALESRGIEAVAVLCPPRRRSARVSTA